MQLTNNFILEKDDIFLSVLLPQDSDALEKISNDTRIWLHNSSFTDPKAFMDEWFLKALEQKEKGTRIPFVIHYQNHVIGSTSFYDIDMSKKIVTIGYTWLHPDYWGSGINTKVKQLLLNYAFKQAKFNQVNFIIDSLNLRSRAAVEKLGARQTGIIYNHLQRPDGTLRDSTIYSIKLFTVLEP